MRLALAFALLIGATPTVAWAGNTAKVEEAKKPVCVRSSESPQRAQRPIKQECRTNRPVPPIVDPTPTFLL